MGDEGFEEWDADFLDQLIQVEELALTSTNPTQHHRLPQPPSLPQISYSPPRELSQRVTDANTKHTDRSLADSAPFVAPFRDPNGEEIERLKRVRDRNAKHPERFLADPAPFIAPSRNPNEQEIERLKSVCCVEGWLQRELGRVSKQLTHLEQDCLQLRNERDKKEEQLKSVYSKIEAKDAEVQCRKSKILDHGVHTHDHPVISLGIQNDNSSNDHGGSRDNLATPTCKAVGVQTDKSWDSTPLCSKTDLSTRQHCQSKLLTVWDSPKVQGSPRNLVSKLLVACETDFHILFGCLGLSAKASSISLAVERSDVGLRDQKPASQSAEAAKVSHLYSMLTKIGAGMVKLEALFEALVGLCSLKDDVIVYRSLRVLRMVLNHTVDLGKGLYIRDNVIVEGPSSSINSADTCELKTESLFSVGADDMSGSGLISSRTRLFDEEILWKDQRNLVSAVSTSCLDWGSVFELMHQIAMKNIEECVRVEAVAIMNMILMRSNAYLDREKFARLLAFESISHLLRKGSGLSVQKQAVRLLYLLLNCPKVMAMFCSFCEEEAECSGAANIDAKNASSQGFSELKLRRSAVTLLAFLASSGKPGFEILLGKRIPKRTSFLAMILKMVVSEMDTEEVNSSVPPEIFRERTLLIREALILLNRLVSNPQYSAPVLRILTNSRDMACLTVDIANRLSCSNKWLWQHDSTTRQMRESEIVVLARVFRKRVFTFLGDTMS
ncbi:hypothetical protein RHGRI_020470 [Rhododendron griersonianum]|uniref:Uncharacterized protein n=1 Tax=Rhododendron griersonianum TaxID=479676 RepID=A0AAV6JGI5_9ERIC|nr:hypothetical protein RHGRI_020470 [Rhododendron griersonianum]